MSRADGTVSRYREGNIVTIAGEFDHAPTDVTIRLEEPDGTIVDLTVEGGELTWSALYDTTGKAPGLYHYEVEGTGAAQANEDWKFRVETRRVAT
jgi:hypothetical protein